MDIAIHDDLSVSHVIDVDQYGEDAVIISICSPEGVSSRSSPSW